MTIESTVFVYILRECCCVSLQFSLFPREYLQGNSEEVETVRKMFLEKREKGQGVFMKSPLENNLNLTFRNNKNCTRKTLQTKFSVMSILRPYYFIRRYYLSSKKPGTPGQAVYIIVMCIIKHECKISFGKGILAVFTPPPDTKIDRSQ